MELIISHKIGHFITTTVRASNSTALILYRASYIGQTIVIHSVVINFISIQIEKLTLTKFFNTVPLLFNTIGPLLHKLPYAIKKRFSAEQYATQALLHSLLGLMSTDGPLILL
jgi:hypothetical protein